VGKQDVPAVVAEDQPGSHALGPRRCGRVELELLNAVTITAVEHVHGLLSVGIPDNARGQHGVAPRRQHGARRKVSGRHDMPHWRHPPTPRRVAVPFALWAGMPSKRARRGQSAADESEHDRANDGMLRRRRGSRTRPVSQFMCPSLSGSWRLSRPNVCPPSIESFGLVCQYRRHIYELSTVRD